MYNVLYVDDEPGLLEIGKLFLEQSGQFTVDVTTSALDALALLNTKTYDAIISDYQMPDMDGIKFLKTLKSSGNNLPFILFTGRGREEVVIEAINSGADFYLQKGGDPTAQFAELVHKIRQAVSRRHAERSLVESEKRLSDIINFLPDATFAIDKSGHVISWNRAIENLTGVSAAEMLGKGDYAYALPFYGECRPILIDMIFSPPDDITSRYSSIVRDGTTLTGETTSPRLRGVPKMLWGKASVLYDKSGNVMGAIESIRDITERKIAELELRKAHDVLDERVQQRTADLYTANLKLQKEIETSKQIDSALKESEERFRTLIEKAPEAILLFDMDLDRYIEANAKAEQLFGCSRQKLLDFGPQQFYLPDQPDGLSFRETVIEHRKQVLAGAELVFERCIRNADGEDRVVEVRLVHLPSSTRKLIRSSYIDITERKRVEVALIKSEERYRSIVEQDYRRMLENIQDVFYRTDSQGNLTLISPSGATLLGYAGTDEMIGKAAADYYADPLKREHLLAFLKKEGSVSNVETTLKRKGGSLVIVSTSSHVYYDAGGNYAGVEGIFKDISQFKRVQEELRQSEELYRILVKHSQNGVFLMQDGILLFCNEAFAAMIGCTPADIIGTPVPDLIAPGDRDMVMERQRKRIAGKVLDESYEFRMLHWDGTTHVPVILSVGLGTYKNRPAVIGTVRSMAKERARDRALHESEEKYRILVETSFDGIVIHQDGLIVYANATAFKLMGSEKSDEIVGKPILSFVYPDYHELVIKRALSATEKNLSVIQEKFIRKDGSVIDVDVVARPFVWKNKPAVHVVFRDVTARREAEKAIRDRESKVRAIFDSTFQFTGIMTPEGVLTDANRTALGFIGARLEDVINRPFWETPWWEGDEAGIKKVREAIRYAASGKFVRYESELQGKDHATMQVDFSIKPVFDADDTLRMLIIEARDITRRRIMEDEVREANKKLNLLSGITRHDILNQLLSLRGYMALSRQQIQEPANLEFLKKEEKVIETIERQIAFTRDYQDMGIQSAAWQNVHEVVMHVATQLPMRDVKVQVDQIDLEILADPLLEKVFYNLIDNALRYGGNMMNYIHVWSQESGSGLKLICEDDGTGISPEDKKRLFTRGFGKNTGFGLFLSREILSIAGSTITENGLPGKGARFEITVPKGKYRFTSHK